MLVGILAEGAVGGFAVRGGALPQLVDSTVGVPSTFLAVINGAGRPVECRYQPADLPGLIRCGAHDARGLRGRRRRAEEPQRQLLERGTRVAALFYSLIESARVCAVAVSGLPAGSGPVGCPHGIGPGRASERGRARWRSGGTAGLSAPVTVPC